MKSDAAPRMDLLTELARWTRRNLLLIQKMRDVGLRVTGLCRQVRAFGTPGRNLLLWEPVRADSRNPAHPTLEEDALMSRKSAPEICNWPSTNFSPESKNIRRCH